MMWKRFTLCFVVLLLGAAVAQSEYPVEEIVKRTAADAAANDGFGKSAALSGDFLVVGAPGDDNANGNDAGAAYVFHRNQGGLENWGQVAKLVAGSGEASDQFGYSVAIDGDYVIVGAPFDDDNGSNAGAVYIFYRNQGGGDNWGQQAKLHHLYPPWAQPGDNCGWSVAIAGVKVIFGVPRNDWAGTDAGVVSSWMRSGTSWTELSCFYASPSIAGDEFGVSVAMTNSHAIVGAWFHSNGGGAAYTFQSIGYWDQEAILLPTGAYAYQKFGASVDISGETVIIGAFEDDVNGYESGSAYIHTRSGGSWPYQAKLLAGDGQPSDKFGWDVGISGATAVVGAPDQNNGNGNYAGALYVYGNEGGWTQIAKHLASDGNAGDWFGQSADVEVATAVGGAPSHDQPFTSAGAVYLFGPEMPPPNDDCADALIVSNVSNLPFDTGNATADGDGSCMIGPNIWFCYTATCTGVATVSLCGSGYDTMLGIYEGCECDPLGEQLCCNDDYCGLQSQCTFAVSGGQEYLIEVGGYSGYTGSGVLSIDCEQRAFNSWAQSVTPVWQGDHQWGDFDGDGDLDLVICGQKADESLITQTYENQAGTLVLRQDLEGVRNTGSGCLGWGDYDGDGDLDLAMAGYTNDETRIARIYENDGAGNLTWDTAQVLTGMASAALDWGDYDNDGDLDLVIVGSDGVDRLTIVYENDPLGTLTEDTAQVLTGLAGGTADWGDFDNDGDLDLITTGGDGSQAVIIYYVNDPPGTLTSDGAHGLPGLSLSDVAAGDYDNDGDLDLAVTGGSNGTNLARVYRNDGSGNFTQVGHYLDIYRSSCVWGDTDNDGDLDLAFFGYTGTSLYTRIYRNDDGVFNHEFPFQGRYEGCISFADIDDDGDLDFFVMGYDWYNPHAEFFQQGGVLPDIAPTPPNQLACTPVGGKLCLSWSGASDVETPTAGLYYALRVGTTPGSHDVHAGTYGSPLMGNVGQATELALAVPAQTYYWSVRSVDSGLRASSWSGEQICSIEPDSYDPQAQAVTPVWQGDHQWGDFDGDGDLDLVICGQKADESLITQTYENQAGTLVLRQDLEGIRNTGSGCLGWGDYDGDGDIDLAMAGYTNDETRIARIYENDGAGNLTWDTAQVLTGVASAALDWGDYDNDGDLDLVIVGSDGVDRLTIVYENDPLGTLTEDTAQVLTGLAGGTADWGDFDNDGDLDLITTGGDGSQAVIIYYVNDPPGTLTSDGAHGLPGLSLSDVAAGDYDNDGDLDLAVTGGSNGTNLARVYRNDGSGNFTQVGHYLDIYRSSCVWGDTDNDGDLDLAFFGYTGTSLYTRIYRNDDGVFNHEFPFQGRYEGCISFADIDDDGDLDFFVMGYDWYNPHAEFFEKRGGYLNSPPAPPEDLALDWEWNAEDGTYVFDFSWSGALDETTPAAGLYYCLRVGTEPELSDICAGSYGSPLMGSSGQAVGMTLVLDQPAYYWSVRSIDTGLMASDWTQEQIATETPETAGGLPAGLHLATNVPNPFNPKTQISYRIPESAAPDRVLLQIYDISGRRVRTLVDDTQTVGVYTVTWNGRNDRGHELASGVYFSRLSWRSRVQTQRMVLIR